MTADDPWSIERITDAAGSLGLTAAMSSTAPDWARFLRQARVLASLRLDAGTPITASCAFVLSPGPLEDWNGDRAAVNRFHNGATDPSSQVWLTNPPLSTAIALDLPDQSINGIFERIGELGLGAEATVIFDLDGPEATFAFYPDGLAMHDSLFEGPLGPPVAPSLDEILSVIGRVHERVLKTNFGHTKDSTLWKKPEKYWVSEFAEKRAQTALVAGLNGATVDPFYADAEVSGDSGRYDIGVRSQDGPGTTTIHSIVELKVVKTFGSSGARHKQDEAVENVLGGIDQVYGYSHDHGLDPGACAVFDLRILEEKLPLSEAQARANALGVTLAMWPCYPNAEHYREFVVEQALQVAAD